MAMNFTRSACKLILNLSPTIVVPVADGYYSTPWLTTRRRTCPICKGDVVRSLSHRDYGTSRAEASEQMSDDMQAHIAEARNDSAAAGIPVSEDEDDGNSDVERGDNSTVTLLNSSHDLSSQPSWRNITSLNFSLGNDTLWHPFRPTSTDRNR